MAGEEWKQSDCWCEGSNHAARAVSSENVTSPHADAQRVTPGSALSFLRVLSLLSDHEGISQITSMWARQKGHKMELLSASRGHSSLRQS